MQMRNESGRGNKEEKTNMLMKDIRVCVYLYDSPNINFPNDPVVKESAYDSESS